MDWYLLAIAFFGGLLLLMATGMPVSFSFGFAAVALMFLFIGQGPGVFQPIAALAYSNTSNFVLVSVPLFVFMAEVILFTGMTEDLFAAIQRWLGRLPGGLAITSIAGCAVFAAITGSSSANTATIGLIAVPEMLKRGYSKPLATASVCAGGALGILIPPSIPFIIYGAIADLSIGRLFFAGMIPGILLAIIFIVYIGVVCYLKPELAPPGPSVSWTERFAALGKTWGAVLMIVAVLGSIYTGIATPTEAAGIGALGSLALAILYRKLTWANLQKAMLRTVRTTSFILLIIVGATSFGYVLTFMKFPQLFTQWVVSLGLSAWGFLTIVFIMYLILGCLMDVTSIIVLTTPILLPVLIAMNIDLIWFGVFMVVNMEMANITPPVGFNLYIMKGIAKDVKMSEVIRGVPPFVALQTVCLILITVFPEIALWLPRLMKGG